MEEATFKKSAGPKPRRSFKLNFRLILAKEKLDLKERIWFKVDL